MKLKDICNSIKIKQFTISKDYLKLIPRKWILENIY